MNYHEKHINKVKSILQESNFSDKVYNSVLDLCKHLEEKDEEVYALGVYASSEECTYIGLSANNLKGLEERIKEEKEKSYHQHKSLEELELYFKWECAYWKHFNYEDTLYLEEANEPLAEITQLLEGLEDYDDVYKHNFFLSLIYDFLLIFTPFTPKSLLPNYYEREEIYNEAYTIMFEEIQKGLSLLRENGKVKPEVFLGIFGGRVSTDFLIEKNIKLNSKAQMVAMIDDFERLGEIRNKELMTKDFRSML